MEILNHPWLLFIDIVLSVFSSWFCWIAFRKKDPAQLLLGIGTAIPTFSVQSFSYWAAGVAVCGVGWWLQRIMGQ